MLNVYQDRLELYLEDRRVLLSGFKSSELMGEAIFMLISGKEGPTEPIRLEDGLYARIAMNETGVAFQFIDNSGKSYIVKKDLDELLSMALQLSQSKNLPIGTEVMSLDIMGGIVQVEDCEGNFHLLDTKGKRILEEFLFYYMSVHSMIDFGGLTYRPEGLNAGFYFKSDWYRERNGVAMYTRGVIYENFLKGFNVGRFWFFILAELMSEKNISSVSSDNL